MDCPSTPGAPLLAVSTRIGPTVVLSFGPARGGSGAGRSTLIWPRLPASGLAWSSGLRGRGPGSLAGGSPAVAGEGGWRGELAGEVTAVGAFGVELGFGAFGACAFGVGEGVSGVGLGLVVCLEGLAFAGGVVTDAAGFGAGVGFGLAGTGDLCFGAAGGLAGGGGRVVAFACVAGGVLPGRGGLLAGFGPGGGGLRGGRRLAGQR